MRMHLIPMLVLLAFMALADGWLYYRWRHKVAAWWKRALYWLPTVAFVGFLAYIAAGASRFPGYMFAARIIWGFWLLLLVYVPKAVYALFDSASILCHKLFGLRPKVLSRIGAGLAVLTVIMLVCGATTGRKRVHVRQVSVQVTGLPEAYDGFRIAQFSDAHLGNWAGHTATVQKTVKLINAMTPDAIMFTGDMVNNFADELPCYLPILRQLHAPYGKYAILGNHDYGDYTRWPTPQARDTNLHAIKQGIRDAGFDLLLNEHRTLSVAGQPLYIVGVENWGLARQHKALPQYGDLQLALAGTEDSVPKILLSHDSSHWRAQVVGREDIVLTLSGHTHAAQMGIAGRHVHWSPSKWIYGEWEGLYKEGNQYLYVNRGLGYVGIPMRVGVPPEVTLITLVRQR